MRHQSEPKAEQPAHHFLLLLGRLDEAWVRPACAKVVVEQSCGVQREQDLDCGAGAMWGSKVKKLFSWIKKRVPAVDPCTSPGIPIFPVARGQRNASPLTGQALTHNKHTAAL